MLGYLQWNENSVTWGLMKNAALCQKSLSHQGKFDCDLYVLLCVGALDGGIQHCCSGVEAELLWYVWAGQKQCADERILS